MRIPWRLKSFLFGAIDLVHGERLLYWLQKYITRRARITIKRPREAWLFHAENLKELRGPVVLEFGAGKSLVQNIFLSTICSRQVVVDLNPMFDASMADKAARELAAIGAGSYRQINSSADLAAYNIQYRAPVDIANSGFEDNSFDACISTDTLEHVPRENLAGIFSELRRILKPGGILSLTVDYTDHYAFTDSRIGLLNFLRFDDEEFGLYNHRVHFQNRLRHGDYEKFFRDTGFTVVVSKAFRFAAPPEKISPEFDISDPNIFATEGYFLLRK